MTSLATKARRATTSRPEDEAGFTLVELLVTMLVMGIVATSVMAVALRTFTTTATITDRRDVLADGRTALDRLSKELRQGESIDQSGSSSSVITFSGYIDGSPATIVWQVTGSSAPYTLEESRLGGANSVAVVTSLADNDVFTYTTHGTVIDQVTVRIPLQTSTEASTSTIVLSTDVQLRNAQDDS
jgi:prepilin-type N-terminal cleavage/methylation domain-containing protein